MNWIEVMNSRAKLKEKFIDSFGTIGALLFFICIVFIIPGLLLVGLAMIGINVDWLSPWPWLGAFLVTILLE